MDTPLLQNCQLTLVYNIVGFGSGKTRPETVIDTVIAPVTAYVIVPVIDNTNSEKKHAKSKEDFLPVTRLVGQSFLFVAKQQVVECSHVPKSSCFVFLE